ESLALDALHTLADLSVNILQPSSVVESESSAQIKDEKRDNDSDGKPGIPAAAVSVYEQKDNSKSTSKKLKRQPEMASTDMVTRKKGKLAKDTHPDGSTTSEVKQQACTCGVKTEKKKKSSMGKILKDEKKMPKDVEKTEVSPEEEKTSSNKTMDIAETTTQVATTLHADLMAKGKSRRKLGIQKSLTQECKPAEGAGDSGSDKLSYSLSNIIDLKDKLSHCLSSRLLRRWCMFEWFYSAIDYPWFAKSEFVEYLNHVKLGHVPRLTHVEWGVIRSSLGKPRRLSKQFLHEEREKLAQYRDSVRQHYTELLSGVREGLPTDLARPLAVGQRVIACHPRTRELHDGNVLTVDHNQCRVQFDRPELGVELVKDIDCMPLHPLENFPESLRHQSAINGYYSHLSEAKYEDQMKELASGGAARSTSNLNGTDATFYTPSGHPMSTLMKQAKANTAVNEVAVATQQSMYNQPCTLSQIQEREADIRALGELSRALDKKEALLSKSMENGIALAGAPDPIAFQEINKLTHFGISLFAFLQRYSFCDAQIISCGMDITLWRGIKTVDQALEDILVLRFSFKFIVDIGQHQRGKEIKDKLGYFFWRSMTCLALASMQHHYRLLHMFFGYRLVLHLLKDIIFFIHGVHIYKKNIAMLKREIVLSFTRAIELKKFKYPDVSHFKGRGWGYDFLSVAVIVRQEKKKQEKNREAAGVAIMLLHIPVAPDCFITHVAVAVFRHPLLSLMLLFIFFYTHATDVKEKYRVCLFI
ncbi:hypothetical protein ACJX0J_041271, partial [Zea mays]